MSSIAWRSKEISEGGFYWALGEPVKQSFYEERIVRAKQLGVWHQYQHLPLPKVRVTPPEDLLRMVGRNL